LLGVAQVDPPLVLRRLEKIASQAASCFPSLRQQVIEDAPGVILLAFSRYDGSRPFTPWAWRVLRNHTVSLHRQTHWKHAYVCWPG
jgi:hypothetical protein